MDEHKIEPVIACNLWSHRSLNHVHAALFQANGNEDMIEITPVSGYEKEPSSLECVFLWSVGRCMSLEITGLEMKREDSCI